MNEKKLEKKFRIARKNLKLICLFTCIGVFIQIIPGLSAWAGSNILTLLASSTVYFVFTPKQHSFWMTAIVAFNIVLCILFFVATIGVLTWQEKFRKALVFCFGIILFQNVFFVLFYLKQDIYILSSASAVYHIFTSIPIQGYCLYLLLSDKTKYLMQKNGNTDSAISAYQEISMGRDLESNLSDFD